MKIRPLPDTDLARIAVLPEDKRRAALEHFWLGFPPYSYSPTRDCLPDIMNVWSPMFGPAPRASWETIAARIVRASRGNMAGQGANLAASRALFEFAVENDVTGRQQDFPAMLVGATAKIRYWSSAVISVGGKAIVPFVDPRKQHAMGAEARRFAMSIMHERIRALDPDYANVALGIFQFVPSDGGRRAILHTDNGVDLIPFDTLDLMVRETYSMWIEVQERREAASKRRTGTGGPLFEGF